MKNMVLNQLITEKVLIIKLIPILFPTNINCLGIKKN